MCDLCGDADEVKKRRQAYWNLAESLEDFAGGLREVASGNIKPHTKPMADLVQSGMRLIVRLIREDVVS